MYELEALSIFAFVALTVSLVTATSAYYLKRKVGPLIEDIDIKGLQGDFRELKDTMVWIKNYASTAPTVMLDHVEGIVNERMEVFGGHLESVVADTKDELLQFANDLGQQGVVVATKLFQGRGASLLGKEGREKSLSNAQIKRASEDMKRQAIEAILPEGITYDMAEGVADRFGVTVEEGIQYLNHPLAQKFLGGMNLSPGGGQPRQPASPPPNPNPSGYQPLGGR